MPEFNMDDIRREIAQKVPGIYELRILMTDFYNTKLSAYFHTDDPDPVLQQMQNWRYPAGCNINFFLTVNPCKEYCEAREQFNSLRKHRIMTQDGDISRYTWLILDVDSEHPAGVCATDEEKAEAKIQTCEVMDYMKGRGFTGPEVVDSGNGYHLKYPIDYANDEEGRRLLKHVTDDIADKFPLVDRAVCNPARILKVPGTITAKGRDTETRPHRMAYIIREVLRNG